MRDREYERRESGLWVPEYMRNDSAARSRFHNPDLAELAAIAERHQMNMADGLFYLDTREPHIVSDITAVTLAATAKALYPAAAFPVLGSQYFNRPGKALKIEMLLKLVTAATPGNVSFNVHWGTGADANGTLVCVAGTPVAWVANFTKLCKVEFWVRCLTTGTAGTLQGAGLAIFDQNHVATPNTLQYFPQAGAAASGALDLTAANIISVQMLRSGSTAETAQVQELKVIALN